MKVLRKIKNSFFSNIYAIVIGTMVISFLLFALVVEGVGYLAFTSSFTEEYKDSVYKSDLVATSYLEYAYNYQQWMDIGGGVMEKYYYNYYLRRKTTKDEFDFFDYDNLEASAREFFDKIGITDEELASIDQEALKRIQEISKIYTPEDHDYYTNMFYILNSNGYTYCEIKDDLTKLADSQNLSVIYLIRPDEGYETFTNIINCPSSKSGYTAWEPGSKHETSPGGYEEAFRRIMEGESEKEVVVRNKKLNGAMAHITALVPVYVESYRTGEKEFVGILCAQRYMDELISSRRNFVQGVAAITVILLVVLTLLCVRFIRKRLIVPISVVSKEAERFANETSRRESSKLEEDVGTINEIKALAAAIDKMEKDTLKNIDEITSMTRNNERMGYEVTLASQIQQGMLPQKERDLSEDSRYDVHALMDPAKEVGGDFFDFFMIDDNHIAILVADVSDKGVAAAFFMAITKTLIKSRAKWGGTASEILTYTDRLIAEKNPAGMFVTVWLGIVDLNTGYVNACNAGHDYPAIMRLNGGYSVDKVQHGPPIGFIPGMEFIEYDYSLKPGERIFLYTDGLPEAKSPTGERFGVDLMLKILNENKDKSNTEIINLMKNRVFSFAGTEPQFDDITMMSFTYYGKQDGDSK